MGRRTIDIDIVLPRRRTGDVFEEGKHKRNHGKFASGASDVTQNSSAARLHRAAASAHTEAAAGIEKHRFRSESVASNNAAIATERASGNGSHAHKAAINAFNSSDPDIAKTLHNHLAARHIKLAEQHEKSLRKGQREIRKIANSVG